MAGTGCAGGETTGNNMAYALPPLASGATSQAESIQIGLSYNKSSAANPSCIAFTDDYPNSPEVQYLSAVADDVAAHYCVDKNKVFLNGYSSGAWEAVLGGLTNQDKIRAYGVQIGGGLRKNGPAAINKPIAAMFVVGTIDSGNPIGPMATPKNDSIGSVAARDELLKRNGCVAPDFQIVDTCPGTGNTPTVPCTAGVVVGDTYSNVPHTMWNAKYPKCHMYTGCPAKYPVVWCPLIADHGDGNIPGGGDGGAIVESYRKQGMWDFFMSLPAP
jgi:poly(3-hydroxybutyrate) depolymerase